MPIQIRRTSPVLIGADPELFLQDYSGKFVSAIGKFGGTKEEPRKLGPSEGMMVQEDNVAVEFNIAPSKDLDVFRAQIHEALRLIEEEARHMKLRLHIVPSARFPAPELDHPKARRFGCDPDFNVWFMRENPPPRSKDKSLRSSGGHVHIAYDKDRIGLGRACDLFAGVVSVLFDDDKGRRQLYGRAGAIREKPYGIEYRTLSNFWIKSPELTDMVFSQIVQAVEFVDSGKEIPTDDARKIVYTINKSEKKYIPELTEKYGLMY